MNDPHRRIYRNLLGVLFIMAASLYSTGCYILSQSTTFLADRIDAHSVERLLSDSGTPEDTKRFLREVQQITDYAISTIGVKASKNYTTYVELNREHLAYIVYAADEFSFDNYIWHFPIAGALPYKGYYKLTSAQEEEQQLREQGYDTWISIVDGFSSLGFFKDPLYSFMKGYSHYRLANLIIHELTHATIWVKDQVQFNEQLASFIGEQAARQYVKEFYGEDSAEYKDIEDQEHDQEVFLDQILSLRTELQAVYDDPELSESDKRDAKERIITSFKARFALDYDRDFRTDQYRHIAELPINNAFIALYGVYHERMSIFEELLAYCHHDIGSMIELLRPFDGTKEDPVPAIEHIIDEGSSR